MTDPTSTTYHYLTDGSEIYRRSFDTIRAEANLALLPPDVAHVATRMIHAAAQTDLPDHLGYSAQIVVACRSALQAGAPILCDSQMVASGVIRSRLPAENDVVCHLGEPRLSELAQKRGTTKTAAAVELWKPRLEGAVVVIGNAPTALFHLLEVVRDHGLRPAGVIGIPVGFVGAAESKQALADNPFGLEYLVLHGRRGGSAIASAALNAISSERE